MGGAAVGVLLTIAAFQLTARYKAEPVTGPTAASAKALADLHTSAAPQPIGWLAESPPKPRAKGATSSGTRDAADGASEADGESSAAADKPKPGQATPEPAEPRSPGHGPGESPRPKD